MLATSNKNLTQASRQWATRPADERFWTLEEARDRTRFIAENTCDMTVGVREFDLVRTEDRDAIALELKSGEVIETNNWSFGQLALSAGAPANYLQKLPTSLAMECIRTGWERKESERPVKLLVGTDGELNTLRAYNGSQYARVWNWQIFDRLVGLQESGWRVPPARPAGNDPRARRATAADVLVNNTGGNGLGIKVGDMIAPAGIYASDRDMFAFMVNESFRVDDGTDGGIARGFFIQNSEVGASSLRFTGFGYRFICGNHIAWNVEDVFEVSVRHVGECYGKFEAEVKGRLNAYANKSQIEDVQRLKRAKTLVLGKTVDEMLDTIMGSLTRRNGLPSGINQKMIKEAHQIAIVNETTDGGPFSVWGMVNGFTRMSQAEPHMDRRAFIDRFAGQLFALAV
jgi:hypothetical protein